MSEAVVQVVENQRSLLHFTEAIVSTYAYTHSAIVTDVIDQRTNGVS